MTRMFSLRLWLTLYDRPRVLDMHSNFSVQCTMILDVRTRVKLSKSLIPSRSSIEGSVHVPIYFYRGS